MTMDQETIDGVLADMAFRVVQSRRRKLSEEIAIREYRRIMAEGGDELPSVAQVAAKTAEAWKEPTAEEVADIVARKCAAAVDYHLRELAVDTGLEPHRQKIAKAEALLAAAKEGLAVAEEADEAGAARERHEQATELLAAAQAAGGDHIRAPGGDDVAAAAQVSGIVADANKIGG